MDVTGNRGELLVRGTDVVVGTGVVGLAVARELTRRTGRPMIVLDKEPDLARHQTGRNSGVVHAGLYYAPGSLKAALCARGVGLLREFCAEHGVPFREIGKIVVAVDRTQTQALGEVHRRAVANGVPGLRRLDGAGLAEIEPQVAGVAALHSPHTAITDFVGVCRAMAREVEAAGGRLMLGTRAVSFQERAGGVLIRLATGDVIDAQRVVVCAGLQSDLLARAAGADPYPRIVPFRGEYLALAPRARGLVKGLVYPVPDPRYPFLGVHATPRIGGEVWLGPNAVLALAREGYHRWDVDASEALGYVRSPALRALAREHWRAGLSEIAGSFLRPLFVRQARRLLPDLRLRDTLPAPAGIRAQAVAADGRLLDDFDVVGRGRVTIVRNAPSPAATSALAIAEHLADHHLLCGR
jgi:(S)-2-hydroxyglutarate dehydrogenase